MTPDDTDTQRGRNEEPETGMTDDEAGSMPPRDPETGKFIPKEERPDNESESPDADAAEGDESAESTDQSAGETDGESTVVETADELTSATMEDEPTDEETADESTAEDTEAEPTIEGIEPAEDSEPDQGPKQADTPTAEPRSAATGQGALGASRPAPRTVFVPNPNGYVRPPTMFLPTHPWLRLPSRPPDHETVSTRV